MHELYLLNGAGPDSEATLVEDSATTDLHAGGTVGNRYMLQKLLGGGGMGEVWRARRHGLGPVAIKFLNSPEEIEEAEFRFRQEARVMASLVSPQSVRVIDFGRHRGRLYLVMELLKGRDLESVLVEKGRLHWREVARLAAEVSELLQEAHARSLVHRDLKPSNIFLQDRPGHSRPMIKVLDFGVAKFLSGVFEGAGPRTGTGRLMGTPEYMAPEQFQGQTHPSSDFYSLGVVMYRALCGRLPFFSRNPVSLIHMHLYDSPPAVEDSSIPAQLRALVRELLAKAPGLRPESAALLRERLEEIRCTPAGGEQEGRSDLDVADTAILLPRAETDASTHRRGWRAPLVALAVIGCAFVVAALGAALR